MLPRRYNLANTSHHLHPGSVTFMDDHRHLNGQSEGVRSAQKRISVLPWFPCTIMAVRFWGTPQHRLGDITKSQNPPGPQNTVVFQSTLKGVPQRTPISTQKDPTHPTEVPKIWFLGQGGPTACRGQVEAGGWVGFAGRIINIVHIVPWVLHRMAKMFAT